jgi:hydrogenase maturation factor
VIARGSDPGTLNHGITTASPAHTIADSIYNGLVQLGAQLNPAPIGSISAAVVASRSPRSRCSLFPAHRKQARFGCRSKAVLSVPGRVIEVVDAEKSLATVDVDGKGRCLCYGPIDAVSPGEWVLVYLDLAVNSLGAGGPRDIAVHS